MTAATLREQWLVLEAPPLAPVVAEIRARCEEAGLAAPSYLTVARRIPALFSPDEIAKKRSANLKHLHRLKLPHPFRLWWKIPLVGIEGPDGTKPPFNLGLSAMRSPGLVEKLISVRDLSTPMLH